LQLNNINSQLDFRYLLDYYIRVVFHRSDIIIVQKLKDKNLYEIIVNDIQDSINFAKQNPDKMISIILQQRMKEFKLKYADQIN